MRRPSPGFLSIASYEPRPAPYFNPDHIVLTRGSLADAQRRDLVDAICAVYPDAKAVERLSVPHNRLDLGSSDPLTLHYRGNYNQKQEARSSRR